jgi:hypothetical protein
VQDNSYELTIQINPMVKGLFLCLTLDPMVLLIGTTMFNSWSLYKDVINGVGHPSSHSISWAANDGW